MKQETMDALRHQAIPDQGLLIHGQWVASLSGQSLPAVSPIDGQIPSPDRMQFRAERIDMVRFGFEMGLSAGMPPELVADFIAQRVRVAVLEQWKSQSVLTPGGGA